MSYKSREEKWKFIKKKKLQENIYSFYFESKNKFDFLPGQYVRLILPHEKPDFRGTGRYFTISSSPLENYLIITTKLVESTFKKTIFSLSPNDKVKVFGPMGNLVLPKEDGKPSLVFLSGGMGITPFRSIISYLNKKKTKTLITLIASFKTPDEMIFVDELIKISKKNKSIRVIFTTTSSHSQVYEDVAVDRGKIHKDLIEKYVESVFENKYFIVGPPVMVEATKKVLKTLKIPNEKIITEDFTGY